MSENNKIHLKEYRCNKCDKIYASHSSLCNHNKKYHKIPLTTVNNSVIPSVNLPTTCNNSVQQNENLVTTVNNQQQPDELKQKVYNCKFCNKSYNIQQSRWKHEQNCNNKINIIEENKKLKQELELIKNNQIVPCAPPVVNEKIIPLNNKSNNYNSNNTNNGTINNGTINTVNNNNFQINQIGKEPIVFRTKDIKSIANDGMNGPITCVRQLNFNKNKPQNHSYCTTSLEGEYCTAINVKTQKPEKVPKKEIIDKVFESAYNFIETIAVQIKEDDGLRNKLSKKEIKEIERIVANKNKYYEKKNWKIFYNSVNSMSYNYRDLVLSTWKLLKPLEKNLISESESSDSEVDSDNEIKEMTEFPDYDDDSDSEDDNNNGTESDDTDDNLTLFDLI
jgi:hypothetical protein